MEEFEKGKRKFMKISCILADEDNFFEDNKGKLLIIDTFINPNNIIEISDVKHDIFIVKNLHDNTYTSEEVDYFIIYLSDLRRYFLEEKELDKFKDLIYE